MPVSYDTARKLLGKLQTIWEQTDPTSQTKTAIMGVLAKAVYSKVANTKTLELTVYGFDNQQYIWEGSQVRVVSEGDRTLGSPQGSTEEKEDAVQTDSSEGTG